MSTDAVGNEGDILNSANNNESLSTDKTSQTITTTPKAENLNSLDAAPFDLNKPFEFSVPKKTPKGKVNIYHKLRRPFYKELEARDEAQPYRSRDIGNNKEQPILDLTNKADIKLYDNVIEETRGYEKNVVSGQSVEERAAALETIPSVHKIEVVASILKFSSKVAYDVDEDVETEFFIWGENVEYRVKTEIGANAQFVVFVTLREPNDKQINDYKRDSTNFVIDKEQQSKPITEVSVKLKPAVEIFNDMVVKVEGITVDGVPFDVNNPSHIELLDAYLKRSVVDAMMKALQLDLGN